MSCQKKSGGKWHYRKKGLGKNEAGQIEIQKN